MSELNIICTIYSVLHSGRAIAQAVSRRPFTAEAQILSRSSLCEICSGQSGTGTGLSPRLRFSPVSIIPPMLHTHLRLRVVLTRRTTGRSLGTFGKQCFFFSEIGAYWVEKYFYSTVGQWHRSWTCRRSPRRALSLSRAHLSTRTPFPAPGSSPLVCPTATNFWERCHWPIVLRSGHEPQEGLDTKTDRPCLVTWLWLWIVSKGLVLRLAGLSVQNDWSFN
jgi:hypothetical protein